MPTPSFGSYHPTHSVSASSSKPFRSLVVYSLQDTHPSLVHLSIEYPPKQELTFAHLMKPFQSIIAGKSLAVGESAVEMFWMGEDKQARCYILIMNSFIETNEEAIDFNAIHPKIKESPKCFAFFIYYQRSQNHTQSTHLQKLAFSIREEKNWNPDKQDHAKLIHLSFVDLENQQELQQSFIDLKMQLLQSPKTKLVFYSSEQHLVETLHKAKMLGVDLSQVPSALYSPDLHEDLTQHLGWRQPLLGDLSQKSSIQFQQNVKKWIGSPGQRIDMWTACVTVDSEGGDIHRLDPATNSFALIYEKQLEEHFISHLSIGHHAQLAANYESNRKEHSHSVLNKMIFGLQSFKKFCCLGNPTLEASTGIVSILFKDEKGQSQEITKHLVREGSKRGVMSLLFSNIDKFMGMKLNGGRLNDGKLEMGVYESSNEFRLVGSSSGEIVVRMNAPQIFMSIGSTCLRLVRPRQLRISHWGKTKVLISKDSLEC